MPTVYKQDGFRVVIFPNSHLPRHVHVFKAGGEVIIQLGNESEPPFIDRIYGNISDKDVAKALCMVELNQTALIEAWKRIHG